MSGNLVGLWLLLPEHLRLGAWDLLRSWSGQPGERVEPRVALQVVREAARCNHALRPHRSLSQRGFELANGLPFVASDPAVHALLDAHTVAEAQTRDQVALGQLRRASGHFPGSLPALDPHRLRSYSKRQLRWRKDGKQEQAAKVSQTFFCVDAQTRQPLCFALATSAPSVSQASPELLRMVDDILHPRPGEVLMADAEHFTSESIAHVQRETPFELLVPAPRQRRITRYVNAVPEHHFTRRWAGFATAKVPFEFADSEADPCWLFLQRSGERPPSDPRRAFLGTADRPEVDDLALHYPKRWHAEEFFNLDDALGWDRARTLNLHIRYGLMTLALLAQAALYPLRQRLPAPLRHWTAEHLATALFQGLDGDLRVRGDTPLVTYHNAPNAPQLQHQFAGLPDKLRPQNVDPSIPWLYNLKLDFRFR